jgi:hypothetical protein
MLESGEEIALRGKLDRFNFQSSGLSEKHLGQTQPWKWPGYVEG